MDEENMMGLNISILTTCESWNMKKIIKNDITPPQKIREKELHFEMQDEECLNSPKQHMCWAPCLVLSIAWLILTSREILKNNWRMKRILDEPPCRASIKNSSNKKDDKKKEKLRAQGEALRWFRWSYKMSKLWTPGKKDE